MPQRNNLSTFRIPTTDHMPQRNNLSTFRWSSYKFKTEIGTLVDNCNVAWRLFFDWAMICLVKNLRDSHTLTARMRVSYWSFITRTHQGTWGSQVAKTRGNNPSCRQPGPHQTDSCECSGATTAQTRQSKQSAVPLTVYMKQTYCSGGFKTYRHMQY